MDERLAAQMVHADDHDANDRNRKNTNEIELIVLQIVSDNPIAK